jgi:hypothetical protein
MSLNCVTGMKANETGRLVKGVTLVTPVTPGLEGGWICALMLPFQIGPTPHCCWPLGWVIALNLPPHLHCTCPLICIRLGKSFASDLTSTLAGPDWQKSTQIGHLNRPHNIVNVSDEPSFKPDWPITDQISPFLDSSRLV